MKYTSPNISRHLHLISQLKDESQEMVKYGEVDGETITQCIQSTTVLTKEIKN